MAPTLEISIPSTSIAQHPKPHTVYTITLRLPLRTFTLQKRYSEFASLHSALTSQAGGQAPPIPLPPKNYSYFFTSTLNNPSLTEKRRVGLERYLREINGCADPRWRSAPAWPAFLNLPRSMSSASSAVGGGNNAASSLHATLTSAGAIGSGGGGPITDPVVWLDTHRELKTHLHAARSILAERDSGSSKSEGGGDSSLSATSSRAADAHEASARAKKEIVRATALLGPLEKGLREQGAEWGAKKLGDGEVRRRRDLVAAAKREIEGLEEVLRLVRKKGEVDGLVEGMVAAGGVAAVGPEQRDVLLKNGGGKGVAKKGRVLGKETARTRELDNRGVLQLQQQMMEEQDEDIDSLARVVRRQRELGEQIQEELDIQNEMLKMVDEDLDRVGGKLNVARKRVDKIS